MLIKNKKINLIYYKYRYLNIIKKINILLNNINKSFLDNFENNYNKTSII